MLSNYLSRRRRQKLEKEFMPGVDKSKLHRVLISEGMEEIDGVCRNLSTLSLDVYRHFSTGVFSVRGYATCNYLQGKRLLKADEKFQNFLRSERVEHRLPAELVRIIKEDDQGDSVMPGRDLKTDDFLGIFRYGNDTKIRLNRSKMIGWLNVTSGIPKQSSQHLLDLTKGIAFNRERGSEWQGPFDGWPESEVEVAAEILNYAGKWRQNFSSAPDFDLADLDADLYQLCFAFDNKEFTERYR